MRLVDPFAAAGVLLGFWVGLVAHEFSTAWAADRGGDKTGRLQRRVSLDVRRHADTLGTYLFPAAFTFAAFFNALLGVGLMPFAYARPHAMSYGTIRRRGRRIWVSAVGPLSMFALAAAFAVASGTIGDCSALPRLLSFGAFVLTSMAVIELLPIPGRDGGRMLAEFLRPAARMRMIEFERYAVAFILGLLLILGFLASRVVSVGLALLPGGGLCLA